MKQHNPKKKIARELREKIDNKVVIVTAVALVSAMVLLFLMNWSSSAYVEKTIALIQNLRWVFLALMALFLVLFFVKKEKKYLVCLPYCAAGTLFMMEILGGKVSTFFIKLLSKVPFIKIQLAGLMAGTKQRFSFLFILLAIYLIASYIYYGIQLKKLNK